MKVEKEIVKHMRVPSRTEVVDAHKKNLGPCAVMCTLFHQQRPSLLRPRLYVFVYSDSWMIYDKYRQARSLETVRELGATEGLLRPGVYLNFTSSAVDRPAAPDRAA